jgi:uncharacterized protein (TIGR00297 family)
MVSLINIALGVLLGAGVGWIGYLARMLTAAGAMATALIGTIIFGFGGLGPAILVLFFFVSSNLLTRYKLGRKQSFRLNFAKGGERDIGQVLANGAVPALLVTYSAFTQTVWPLIGFVGAMAAATGDTWATELGVLSKRQPRSILNGKIVPRGTSGGVTLFGYIATALGSLAIGMISLLVVDDWRIVVHGLAGGLAGATVDSLLGASVQVMYYCTACEVETESSSVHHCGGDTIYRRGWRWLTNDAVNLLAGVAGAAISIGWVWLW